MVDRTSFEEVDDGDYLAEGYFNGIYDAVVNPGNITQQVDSYIKNENMYISAGATDTSVIGTNAYYSNGAWTFPDTRPGGFLFFDFGSAIGDIAYYTHDGTGSSSFVQRFRYDASASNFTIIGGISTTTDIFGGRDIFSGRNIYATGTSGNLFGFTMAGSALEYDGANIQINRDNDFTTTRLRNVVWAPETYSSTVGATNRNLSIDNTGLIGGLTSALRYKENIIEMDESEFIYSLRPVVFDFKEKHKGLHQYGLIAEEVEQTNPNLCIYNLNKESEEFELESVNYEKLIVPMLKEIQKLRAELDELKGITRKEVKVPYYEQMDGFCIEPKEELTEEMTNIGVKEE